HENFGKSILNLRRALLGLSGSSVQANPSLQPPAQGTVSPNFIPPPTGDLCALCNTVFEETTAICSLYALTGNQLAAAICEATVLYEYNQCLVRNYCYE
ncbi:MAG: hypothetical protein ACRD1F_10415, partial [Terriglobales bacterium]